PSPPTAPPPPYPPRRSSHLQPLADRKEVLAALKKQAAKADTVYLAPDPDREGEAIAWHLKEALGLADDKTRRVTFNEITKRAIQDRKSTRLNYSHQNTP